MMDFAIPIAPAIPVVSGAIDDAPARSAFLWLYLEAAPRIVDLILGSVVARASLVATVGAETSIEASEPRMRPMLTGTVTGNRYPT